MTKKRTALTFTWITLAAAAPVLAVTSLCELFRYSPYEDPGALQPGVLLGIAAVITGLAAIILPMAGPARRAISGYSAFKRSLTPQERMAAAAAEAMALGVAHEAWRRHNEQVSAHLASGVMGGNGSEPAGS